jgi:hypothetical protein
MTGVSSGYSVSALSGRCPRIALRDPAASPFPATPLRTVRAVLPHTALPRSVTPRQGQAPSENDRLLTGGSALRALTQRLSFRSVIRLPGLPSGGVLLSPPCKRYYARLRLPLGPVPARLAPLPHLLTQAGLSRSPSDCPCLPRPLRRGVLGGCTSQGFTASMAFADLRAARLPLAPGSLRGCLTTPQTARDAADCRWARPPEEGFVSGLRRGDFAPFSMRRRSATRRLGPYRDRTCTGKPLGAYLDAPPARHSRKLSTAGARKLPGS